MNSNDIAVYLHIPFCVKRCLYCDYVSTTNLSLKAEYFNALSKEITLKGEKLKGRKVRTIYFGGGTPSFVEEEFILQTFRSLQEHMDLSDLEEFTIEVNPESVEEKKVHFYKEIGINRVSMGFQSTSDKILKTVGRSHDFNKELESYKLLTSFYDNINIDFIVGLPYENFDTVNSNLEFIEKMKPSHISYYLLDSSHDTPLKHFLEIKEMKLPEDDLVYDLLDYIYDQLKKLQYNRYEISSWSLHQKECIHNQFYWYNLDYVGFGISAGGHINKERYVNTSDVKAYITKLKDDELPYDTKNVNDEFTELLETLFMSLRLTKGITYDSLIQRFSKNVVDNVLNQLKNNLEEYISIEDSIKLTTKGLNFSRFVFENLLDVSPT
ncbi:radical SAM family heme chaperone HemW [Petrotoga olearia]|uniref:Heme chaperone HemW n=2 Tax=Petrotoga olearia TaxID=156203 RepID=A0A2K1NWZ7_9BACT|nr:radical SAM family heme chaperone HemW [Petrotoga olearia]PNR95063.1 coproporphyrinogen III oxidase [Petrotoga olearia DSM 13574]RMA72895.1 oxygen-independent coproporphyrinogen-3 oxidase [Petrotoga olearia]